MTTTIQKEVRPGEGKRVVLGDEWTELELSHNEPCRSGRTRYMTVHCLFALALIAALGLFEYLVHPRLHQIHPSVAAAAFFLTVVGAGFIVAGTVSVLAALVCYKVPLLPGAVAVFRRITPGALWLGTRIGLQRDRLYHSFIKVHNTLIPPAGEPRVRETRPLMLLPRCLTPQQKQQLKDLAAKYSFQVYSVGGGEAARRVLEKEKPTSVIAVACERDLVSGIRDIAGRVPVIGIPNERPDGPCRNTLVELNLVEGAMKRLI